MKLLNSALLLFQLLMVNGASSLAHDLYEQKFLPISRSPTLTIQEKTTQLINEYNKNFKEYQGSCAQNSNDATAMFMAANMLAGYTMFTESHLNSGYIQAMESCLRTLETIGKSRDSYYRDLYGALMASRQFDKANEMSAQKKLVVDPSQPSISYSEGFNENYQSIIQLESSDKLSASTISLSPESQIIVISGCHFAFEAIKYIEADSKLRDSFSKGNAIWIAPADRNLDYRSLLTIKRNYPRIRFYVAYKNSAWPAFDFSTSPNFYFLKNGKILHHHEGWGEDGVPHEIISALQQMRLLKE